MTPPSVCGRHTYDELSARNKLARHRLRGDFDEVAWWCDECTAWHVEVGVLGTEQGETK